MSLTTVSSPLTIKRPAPSNWWTKYLLNAWVKGVYAVLTVQKRKKLTLRTGEILHKITILKILTEKELSNFGSRGHWKETKGPAWAISRSVGGGLASLGVTGPSLGPPVIIITIRTPSKVVVSLSPSHWVCIKWCEASAAQIWQRMTLTFRFWEKSSSV